jgi:hypothetical protein
MNRVGVAMMRLNRGNFRGSVFAGPFKLSSQAEACAPLAHSNPLALTSNIKGLAKMLILFYFQLDDLLDDCGGTEGLD